MNERRLSAFEEDWLAGNAVVAFVGCATDGPVLEAIGWRL